MSNCSAEACKLHACVANERLRRAVITLYVAPFLRRNSPDIMNATGSGNEPDASQRELKSSRRLLS